MTAGARRVSLLLLAAAALAGGCTAVIRPPRDPVDPVTVALVDYGRHSSLILPGRDAGSVEFAYGEWNWFALNRTGFFHAIALAVWPHQGALGRRAIPVRTEPAALGPHVACEELFAIRVARADAERLLDRLEAQWRAGSAGKVENPEFGLAFVKIDDDYLLCSNCNHMTARWLRELGCDVGGSACCSSFRIEVR